MGEVVEISDYKPTTEEGPGLVYACNLCGCQHWCLGLDGFWCAECGHHRDYEEIDND